MHARLRRVVILLTLLMCWAAAPAAFAGGAQGVGGPPATGGATSSAEPEADAARKGGDNQGEEAKEAAPSEGVTEPQPAQPVKDAVPSDIEQLVQPVGRTAGALDASEKRLEEIKDSDDQLADERAVIARLIEEAQKEIETLRPRLEAVRSQIEKLGAPPAKDGPAESADIAAERKRLGSVQVRIDAAVKTAELTQVRAGQLMQRVRSLRQTAFARELFRRTLRHPLSGKGMAEIRSDIGEAWQKAGSAWRAWWAAARPQLGRLAAIIVLGVAGYLSGWWLRRRWRYEPLQGTAAAVPKFAQKATATAIRFLGLAAPPLILLTVLYIGLDLSDLLYRESGRVIKSALRVAAVVAVVRAAVHAVLRPGNGAWRLVDVTDSVAQRINLVAGAMAVVYGVDRVVDEAVRELSLGLPVSVAWAFTGSLVLAALLALLAAIPLQPRPIEGQALVGQDPGRVSRWQPRWLKIPLVALAFVIAAATLLGYVALGQFLATQTVLTGAALASIGLVHLGVRALTAPEGEGGLLHGLLGSGLGLEEGRGRQVLAIVRLLLGLLLALASIPLLMLSLGIPADEVAGYVRAGFFGFEIGHFRISLARILMAAAIFISGAFVTRLLQRWLTANVLTVSRVDTGIANSIETGLGYAGIGLAALIAISYAGLDITNVAIVAGALSVGIGFGLQSIVNNFVSGLIVLVERPVKVGDWIVVKGVEGYVRRISVRATEIETFDRASVIVPNSELITGAVTNWTLRNALGRITVKVRVAYSADPERVLAVLTNVAKANTLILQYPEPLITLDNLGNDGLDFSVRVLVADINKSLKAQTALRAEVVKAFRAEGIAIPHLALVSHLGASSAASGVTVRVKTSLKADAEVTAAVLAGAARGVAGVAAEPAPTVALDAIGDNGLEFSVAAPLEDGATPSGVESQLRMAIVTALNRAGIEIAVGQRDIHIRDLDVVREFLARAAQERMRKAAEEGIGSRE